MTDENQGLDAALGLELGRLVERWRMLPLDRASGVLPQVHALLAALEEETARVQGRASVPVPSLGASVAMDQLTVLVQDRAAVGLSPADAEAWTARLADLRAATWE